ncbi:MAG TPA: NAD(P)H-dependent glycerol-3-phosphate dehydrogenase [Chroococcales cyanobacterium]
MVEAETMNVSPQGLKRLVVLGAGSWGSTLALVWSQAGKDVAIWTQTEKKAEQINTTHTIEKPLTVQLPSQVRAYSDLTDCLATADALIFCLTSQSLRSVAQRVQEALRSLPDRENIPLISAVKGLELSTKMRMSQLLEQEIPGHPVFSLSGPNLAREILAGQPTASVIAAHDIRDAEAVQQALTVPKLRMYSNDDLAGVELGGTLKNVIAIAAGVSDGLNLGANAKAALLTRGLAEMTRLAVKLGARPSTLAGLSGMGDLFATCSGPTSRNYLLGMELAKGKSLDEVLREVGAVIEGVPTTEAVCELSKTLRLELPIAEQVEATLKGKSTPKEAIMTLMQRRLVHEFGEFGELSTT